LRCARDFFGARARRARRTRTSLKNRTAAPISARDFEFLARGEVGAMIASCGRDRMRALARRAETSGRAA
jgi:hypothetical protein